MDIIVYCEGEQCGASLHLSEELIKLQYTNVKVFLDGWVEWNKAGYPMGIIMMEVEVSKATQKEILDFYKTNMTQQGWDLKSLKDYGKNGSVMELVKEDIGTLSAVTILKKNR
jgi:hypothetical protein